MLCAGGIGATAANRAAEQLVTAGATALLSWGSAAGLISGPQAGDVFIPEVILDNGGNNYPVDAAWRTRLKASLRSSPINLLGGALADSSTVLQSPADKQRLYHATGALAADMESAAVAHVARRHEIPFLCIRAIADSATMSVPPALLAMLDNFGRPRLPALLLQLSRRPGLIPELFRLGRAFGAATRSLRIVARDADGVLGLAERVRK